MKAAFTIASSLLLLSSAALASEDTLKLPVGVVVDGCSVPSGAIIPLIEMRITDDVKNIDGTCLAIPAGVLVVAGTVSTRINLPDGRVVLIQSN